MSAIVGPFCRNFIEIISLKAPENDSASIGTYNFSVCLWESPNPQLYDFGILGRVPEPQNHQLCLSLETPGYLKQIKNPPGTFASYF